MATEIELKAWVDDPQAIRDKIDTFAEFIKAYQKVDTYWLPIAELKSNKENHKRGRLGSGVRVRQENGKTFITVKKKEVREEMEINDELEFEVSDSRSFEAFLTALDFAPWIRKSKEGTAWRWKNITIELSQVQKIGWFVELEILAETINAEQVAQAREDLLSCLNRIGIPRTKIESRYYTELLIERGLV